MDENFQNYNNNHSWLQYNNYHQDHGLLEIPFSGQISNAINPENTTTDHQFFMDHHAYVGHVSRFHSDDHGEVMIPKDQGSNSTTTAFMEDSSCRKEGSCTGKAVKRRSRASRRTPPTLLNASVKNFRDLVQQYTGCESSSGKNNQKGPINLSFGSSSDHHHHQHQQQQQIDHFSQIPGFDGRYDHQNYLEQQSYQEYDHVKQGFM